MCAARDSVRYHRCETPDPVTVRSLSTPLLRLGKFFVMHSLIDISFRFSQSTKRKRSYSVGRGFAFSQCQTASTVSVSDELRPIATFLAPSSKEVRNSGPLASKQPIQHDRDPRSAEHRHWTPPPFMSIRTWPFKVANRLVRLS